MSGLLRRPRLRTWLLLSAGLWLMLRQVDGVLAELQLAGYGGYGVADLGPLSPAGLPAQVKALLTVWQANHALAHAAFYVYTAIDTIFIALYAGLLHALLRRVGASPRANGWLIAAVVADLLENALRVAIVAAGSHAPVLVYTAWLATSAKSLALLAVLLLVAHALYARRVEIRGGGTLEALWRVRIPLVLLGPFGLLLIFDPTGQSPDTFRRWFDDGGRFVTSLLWTVGGTALLSAVAWTTVRRTVLGASAVAARPPQAARWALAAVALSAIAFGLGWTNLLGFVVVIVLVFGLGVLARALGLGDDYLPLAHELLGLPTGSSAPDGVARLDALAGAPDGELLPAIQRVARAIGAWPLLALLLALVSAWTAPPLVLLALEHDAATAIPCAIGAVVSLLLTPVVAFELPRVVRRLDDRGPPRPDPPRVLGVVARLWPQGLELRHVVVFVACLGGCAAAVAWPLTVPPAVGVVGMLSVGIGALVAGLGEAQRYGERHKASSGLRMLGFDGLPVVGLLALAFGVASVLDDGSYHGVARTAAVPPAQAGTPLSTAFSGWLARNCARDDDVARAIPMVFVASQGGGIRSAYWTAAVLTTLLGAPAASASDPACPSATAYDRLFALNGVSGGSLGVSSYAGNANVVRPADPATPWYRTAWGTTDLASVPTTWGLLAQRRRVGRTRSRAALRGGMGAPGRDDARGLLRVPIERAAAHPLLDAGRVGLSDERVARAADRRADPWATRRLRGAARPSGGELRGRRAGERSTRGRATDVRRPGLPLHWWLVAALHGGAHVGALSVRLAVGAAHALWPRRGSDGRRRRRLCREHRRPGDPRPLGAPGAGGRRAQRRGRGAHRPGVRRCRQPLRDGRQGRACCPHAAAPRAAAHLGAPGQARRPRRRAARRRGVLGRPSRARGAVVRAGQRAWQALRPHRAARRPRHPGAARLDVVEHGDGRPRPPARRRLRRRDPGRGAARRAARRGAAVSGRRAVAAGASERPARRRSGPRRRGLRGAPASPSLRPRAASTARG